jgi:TetR/AcrR family transcriptional repressor of nem operon
LLTARLGIGDNHCLAIKTTFDLAAADPEIKALLKEDSDFTHSFF